LVQVRLNKFTLRDQIVMNLTPLYDNSKGETTPRSARGKSMGGEPSFVAKYCVYLANPALAPPFVSHNKRPQAATDLQFILLVSPQ
jgi:hypothetical protein